MTTLNPYINFKDSCREAMTFSKECLGGNLIFQTVGGSPMEDKFGIKWMLNYEKPRG